MKKFFFTLGLIALVPLHSAQAATCANTKEKQAIDLRTLQSQLMVSALSCGMQPEYNSFIEKFNPVLASAGGDLKSYFTRVYSGRGKKELNSFVTRLANDISQQSLSSSFERFCIENERIFQSLSRVSPSELGAHITRYDFSPINGINECGTGGVATAR